MLQAYDAQSNLRRDSDGCLSCYAKDTLGVVWLLPCNFETARLMDRLGYLPSDELKRGI